MIPAPRRSSRILQPLSVAFALTVIGQLALVLYFPVPPAQDLPLHEYYAGVFTSLLKGSADYSPVYLIKYYFPPYLLQTYATMLIQQLFGPGLVGCLLAILYVAMFAFGFRYFVRSVGPGGDLVAVMAAPFAFHRLYYFGFFNFVFGLGLSFVVLGFWWRNAGRLSPGRLVVFYSLIVLLLFTHPMSLGLCLCFLCAHWLTAVATGWSNQRAGLPAALRPRLGQLLALAAACASFLYVLLFTEKGRLLSYESNFGEMRRKVVEMFGLLQISPFKDLPYRLPLFAVCALAGYLLLEDLWRRRTGFKLQQRDYLLLLGVGSLAIFPVLPQWMNTAGYFDERFPLVALFLLFAYVAGASVSTRRQIIVGMVSLALCLVTLAEQGRRFRPLGDSFTRLSQAPTVPPGSVGLILRSRQHDYRQNVFAFQPCIWQGARYFQRSRALLGNNPWLPQPHMLLGLQPAYVPYAMDAENLLQALVGKTRQFPRATGNGPNGIDFVFVADCSETPAAESGAAVEARQLGFKHLLWADPSWAVFTYQPESAVAALPAAASSAAR